MQILIAEDEMALSNAIKQILTQNGYFVDAVYDGATAVEYAESMSYDLIILDVMMPEADGFEVVKKLRRDQVNTPILMLTARNQVQDKVSGLNFGADDYMTKPFETDELLARISALTRRKGKVYIEEIRCGDLRLDLASAVLHCGESYVQLSKKEFDVIKEFFYNPHITISSETLIVKVWGIESEATDNNVEVYISFIRKKLKFLGSKTSIKKVQKIGYRLETEQ